MMVRLPACVLALLLLAGCAARPQLPVALAPDVAPVAPGQKVGVVFAAIPKASMEAPGANCLLCMAAAQMANASLARHLDTLDTGELTPAAARLAEALRREGADVRVIAERIDLEALPQLPMAGRSVPRRDFSSLRQKYGVDKLLVVRVDSHGISRPYTAYIPTGAPQVYVKSTAFLVNLATNVFDWYQPVNVFQPVAGDWDEPPKYPGLSNAYYQAIETSKNRLVQGWTR